MEINLSKKDMEQISSEYHSLTEKLNNLEKEYNEEAKISNELDSEYEFTSDYLNIESAKVETKKNQIYRTKKRYMQKREMRHYIKTMLIGISIPALALALPVVREFMMADAFFYALNSILFSLITLGADILMFSDKNANRYAKDYYKTEQYIKLSEELKILEEAWKRKLNEYHDIVERLRNQNLKVDSLKTSYNQTKNKILKLKEKLFNKMFNIPEEEMIIGDEITEEKPMELTRK